MVGKKERKKKRRKRNEGRPRLNHLSVNIKKNGGLQISESPAYDVTSAFITPVAPVSRRFSSVYRVLLVKQTVLRKVLRSQEQRGREREKGNFLRRYSTGSTTGEQT